MTENWISRRKSPRRLFHRKIGVLCGGDFEIHQARQIGEGGLLFLTDKSLTQGTQVVVTFVVPGHTTVVVRAEVRYSLTRKEDSVIGIGVQFINLPFENKRAIRHFVADKSEGEAQGEVGEDHG